MLIYTSSLWYNQGDCAPPESRRYGANLSGDMNVCAKLESRQYGAKSSGGHDGDAKEWTGGAGSMYTHKKSIDELKRREVDRRVGTE